jgi:hypothetical protein
MTSNKRWQTLVSVVIVCCAPKLCYGTSGLTQNGSQAGADHSEFAEAAKTDFKPDAAVSPSQGPLNAIERIISWELPIELHAKESSIGGINASYAAEELARWNIGGNGDANYVSNRLGYHPATRVIVDVEASDTRRNRVSETPLSRHYLAEFRNLGYWSYRICFESSELETHSKGGGVWMQVRINKRGHVAAQLLKSNFDRSQTAVCILNATRSIALSRTTGAILDLRIRVFPGDAPLSVNRKLSEDKIVVEPRLLREALRTVESAIVQCVRDGLGRDPRLWGRLAMVLQFNKQGQLVRSDEYDSHFPDASVVKCMNFVYRDLHLAPLAESTKVVVALRVGSLPKLTGESNVEPRQPARSPSPSNQ